MVTTTATKDRHGIFPSFWSLPLPIYHLGLHNVSSSRQRSEQTLKVQKKYYNFVGSLYVPKKKKGLMNHISTSFEGYYVMLLSVLSLRVVKLQS